MSRANHSNVTYSPTITTIEFSHSKKHISTKSKTSIFL